MSHLNHVEPAARAEERPEPLRRRLLPALAGLAGLLLIHRFWGFGGLMTVVGLGGLIFFHELGHFLACRLTGTRVDAFSVGFGPMLVGWRRGNTLYKISAIPLGGYVKMAAENPGDSSTGAPDEFPNKSYPQRLFIMANGVVFNVVLAFVFYVWAFRLGVPFPRAELGDVAHGQAGWEAGLVAGDLVTHIDGEPIVSFEDLKLHVAFSGEGEELALTVRRGDRTFETTVRPAYSAAAGMPVIGVDVAYERAAETVAEGSPIAKAGGLPGDVVLALNGLPVPSVQRLALAADRIAGEAPPGRKQVPVVVTVRRASGETAELKAIFALGGVPQLGVQPYVGQRIERVARSGPAAGLVRPGDRLLSVNGRPVADLGVLRDAVEDTELATTLRVERNGQVISIDIETPVKLRRLADSVAAAMDMDSTRVAPRAGMAAARAGLRAGDRVLKVGNTEVKNWAEIKQAVASHGGDPLPLAIDRDGKTLSLTVQPARHPADPLGYGFRVGFLPHREHGVFGAMAMGWRRTVISMKSVLLTIRSLITRRVSARHIGGPITLARVTYRVFDHGWARYLYILALISINLAVLNLLPIPILDGGQIVLLTVERLRGRPTPERVVGWLQMAGLVVILGLLAIAFRNDIAGLLNR